MTNEELVALIQAGDHVQDNMGQLYQQNREFIIKLALPYSKSVELEDLLQEAYFGLEKAVQRYDPTTGFKFLTYAENWIRQSIHRYCQNSGNLKRLPVHVLENISKYQKFRSDFQSIVGDEPTDEEYCHYLGTTPEQLKTLRKYMVGSEPVSLEGTIPGADNLTLGETLADEFNLEETVCDYVAEQQDKEVIWGAVAELDSKQADIITSHFKNGESMETISDRLEISKGRVHQLKNRAIQILRRSQKLKKLADSYGYGCAQAYNWGLGHYRNTGTSSTEFLAMKHIEQEESMQRASAEIRGLSSISTLSSHRIKQRDGYVPVGLQSLDEMVARVEALLKEVGEEIKKAKSKGA